MLLRDCFGGRTWPLRLEGVGPGEQGGTSSSGSFWSLETSFHACTFRGPLDFVLFHHVCVFLVFDTQYHATLSDGTKRSSHDAW